MNAEFEYVEKPFIELLKDLGWETILSLDDANKFVPKLTLRASFDEVLIEQRLRAAIAKLNDWLDEEQVEEAVQGIKRIGLRKGLIEANMGFLNLLLEPTAFKNKKDPQGKNRS